MSYSFFIRSYLRLFTVILSLLIRIVKRAKPQISVKKAVFPFIRNAFSTIRFFGFNTAFIWERDDETAPRFPEGGLLRFMLPRRSAKRRTGVSVFYGLPTFSKGFKKLFFCGE